jgi:hypothetical protein
VLTTSSKSFIPFPRAGVPHPTLGLGSANCNQSRGDLVPEVSSRNTISLVLMEEIGDTGIISSLRVRQPDVLPLCDLNIREIELRMGSLEFGKSL